MRQLFDFKTGARRGPWGDLMRPVVANMSVKDMMEVSAYAASIQPPATTRATTMATAR
jgi:cytochrome c553